MGLNIFFKKKWDFAFLEKKSLIRKKTKQTLDGGARGGL